MNKVEKQRVARKGIADVVQLGLPGSFRQGLREVSFDQGMQVVLAQPSVGAHREGAGLHSIPSVRSVH